MFTRICLCFIAVIISLAFISCASTYTAFIPPDDNDFNAAETGFLAGKFREASLSYQVFIAQREHAPYKPYVFCQLGICALALGENNQSIEHFNKALSGTKDPVLKVRILTGLGNAYSSKREYTQAVSYYKKALKDAREELSDEANVLFKLATALMRSGDWGEARKYLNELIVSPAASDDLKETVAIRLALPEKTFIVQLGKFQDKDNAAQSLADFKQSKNIQTEIKVLLINSVSFYFIWAGTFPDWQSARQRADELQSQGIEALVIP
jgi:tetratricopeptide (TPR) repeat protein